MAGLKNNYQFEFTDTLTTSGTSVRISNEKENGAVATFTNQYITVRSEDNSIVERMKGSAADGVLTLTMRGLDQSDTDTQNAGLKKEWREGSKAFVTYVASQHVDPRDDNTFSGTQTFNNVVVSQDVTIGDDLTVSGDISVAGDTTLNGKYKGPLVNDITARNTLYPTPVDGNIVQVKSLNSIQFYQTSLGGRQTLGVGTPPADASETVKGIAEIATQAEVDAGTSDTTIVTPLKLKTQQPEALVDKDTYILGEDCLVNDSLFPETAPTFAESTLVQNIGDVTANTRVSIIGFGSGVSGNTIKLALRKYVSPSADLSIRLETVDDSGNPTGTLVDANATATVTAASLTTSLVDTTVTFAGSFVIPYGQKHATVLRQVGDVVNATNYYGIGYVARDTNTRGCKSYNGTYWNATNINSGINQTQSFSFINSSGVSQSDREGAKITMTANRYLTEITKDASTPDTIAYLTDSSRTVIAQANYVGNVATFTPQLLTSGTTYYILSDKGGASRTFRLQTGRTFPSTYTGFNLVAGLYIGSDSSSQLPIITSITTQAQISINGPVYDNIFHYTYSTLFSQTVLGKTSATYSYKLPTDFPRIASEAKSAGQNVITSYYGLKGGFTGLSPVTYYVGNTPGLISATAGTNVYPIGEGIDSNTLNINTPVTNNGLLVDSISAGTSLTFINAPTLRSLASSVTFVTIYSVTITKNMFLQMDWQYRKVTVVGSTPSTSLWVNGVSVYSVNGANSTSFQNGTFSGLFNLGDFIEIKVKELNGIDNFEFQNFTARYNKTTQIFYTRNITI